jgi:hypothetical protein
MLADVVVVVEIYGIIVQYMIQDKKSKILHLQLFQ